MLTFYLEQARFHIPQMLSTSIYSEPWHLIIAVADFD